MIHEFEFQQGHVAGNQSGGPSRLITLDCQYLPMVSGERPADEPIGNMRWSGEDSGPVATSRVDPLAAGAGALVAIGIGVFTPLHPAFAVVLGGPVAGVFNRVYDAELAAGFLAGILGSITLAALELLTNSLAVSAAAAGGLVLLAPITGLVAGIVAIPFGRARERFTAGRRSA